MLGAAYVLSIVGLMFVRAMSGAVDVARGFLRYRRSARVDWAARLTDLERAMDGLPSLAHPRGGFRATEHKALVEQVSGDPGVDHAPLDPVPRGRRGRLQRALLRSSPIRSAPCSTPRRHQTGCSSSSPMRNAAAPQWPRPPDGSTPNTDTASVHSSSVEHPAGVPGEIAGKGANITYAGYRLAEWVRERAIDPRRVIVTSLDCDNIPHDSYFDCVAYEYAIAPDRERLSFQPISLYITNIWDVPAPSRVVASANCFWNLTTTVRRLALRNFASHAQPLTALVEMGFWSKRTIVEDGHQYWRSWFHFDGDYRVVPIHVPIFQDAVQAGTFTDDDGRSVQTAQSLVLRCLGRALCRGARVRSPTPAPRSGREPPVPLAARRPCQSRLDLDHHRHRRLDPLRRGLADGAGHLGWSSGCR
jgi:hypothetical protein